MKKLYVATAALLATTAIASVPAFAADKSDSTAKQIEILKDQLRAMQQQLDTLQSKDAAAQDAIAKETAARQASEKSAQDAALAAGGHLVFENGMTKIVPPAPSGPKVVESGTHRFSLSSADGQYTIGLTGRLHFDMGDYVGYSPKNPTLGGINASISHLSNGVNARRARLGVTGKAAGDFTYTFIYDFGNSQDTTAAGIQTAQIGYTGIKNTIIEAGYSDTFFTLEEAQSSNDIMFMERASPEVIATSVNAGDFRANVGARTWGDNYWVGAYLTGPSTTGNNVTNTTANPAVVTSPGVPAGDSHTQVNERFGAYERASFQVIQDPHESVHVGVGVSELFKAPNSGIGTANTITLSDRPELRIDPTSFVSTGGLGTVANPVTSARVYNIETAAAYENFFYQGEYFHYTVDRLGKTAANFNGGYGEVSYTFGGHRTYMPNTGAYSGVNPTTPFSIANNSMGAIELAARVSYVDLVDQIPTYTIAALGPNSVNGGRQTNYTFGINWYLNSNMRMMFNYIHSDFAKKNPSAAGAVNIGDNLDAIAARLQFVF